MEFLKRLLCKHVWYTRLYSYKHYDEEVWVECTKCGVQK